MNPNINVGSRVQYVPDFAHAFERDAEGNYPWVLGRRDAKGQVQELDTVETKTFLAEWRRSRDPETDRKKIVFVRPNRTWPATVTAVNPDGTVDLDIQAPNSCVTLHYPRVPVTDPGQERKPHTCF